MKRDGMAKPIMPWQLRVIAGFSMLTLLTAASSARISLTTASNVQYTDRLPANNWTTLTILSGHGAIMTVTDPDAALRPQRFYRARPAP